MIPFYLLLSRATGSLSRTGRRWLALCACIAVAVASTSAPCGATVRANTGDVPFSGTTTAATLGGQSVSFTLRSGHAMIDSFTFAVGSCSTDAGYIQGVQIGRAHV